MALRRFAICLVALTVTAAGPAGLALMAGRARSGAPPTSHPAHPSRSTLADGPPALRRAMRATLDAEAYAVRPAGGGSLAAANPANALAGRFSPDRVELAPTGGAGWRAGIRLDAFGPAPNPVPVPAAAPVIAGDRVEYRRGTLTEWYRNDRRGVEQGFTLAAPPAGAGPGGALVLRLGVSGTLHPVMQGGGVVLAAPGGAPVLNYRGLTATGADGSALPAHLAVDASAIVVTFDPSGARYPVTVDPIFTQQAKLVAGGGASDDLFGSSVAVDGDTAVVGAPFDQDKGTNAGAAYVFVRSGTTWVQQAKLVAADGAAGDLLGTSVAVSGGTAVVGAYADDDDGTNSGSAYVFVRTGTAWSQQARLGAGTDGALNNYFGYSVAVSGDTAVVGAYQFKSSGAVFVFVRSGASWSRQAELVVAGLAPGYQFGWSVSLSGDTIVAGADRSGQNGPSSGSAYVFVRSGTVWSQQSWLLAGDGAAFDRFGVSVAVSGDTAVVGADRDDDKGTDSGSAYVFVRSGVAWARQAKLVADDGAAYDYFGYAVALAGDTAVVGASADDDKGLDSGSAYVFVRSGTAWSQLAKRVADDGAANDYFGTSVALSGDTAVVGARRSGVKETRSPSAYVLATQPSVTIDPGSLDFGPQPQGTPGPARTLTVTNRALAVTFVFSVNLGGDNPGDFTVTSNACNLPIAVPGVALPLPVPLLMGQTCAVEVVFNPTALGSRGAWLAVGHSGPEESVQVPLSGTGRAPVTTTTTSTTTTTTTTAAGATTTTSQPTPHIDPTTIPGETGVSAVVRTRTGGSRDGLPRTGFGATPLVAGALVLIDIGALAVLLARRQRWSWS